MSLLCKEKESFHSSGHDRVREVLACLQGPPSRFVFGGRDRQAVCHHDEPLREGLLRQQRKGLVHRGLLQLLLRDGGIAIKRCAALALPQPLQ